MSLSSGEATSRASRLGALLCAALVLLAIVISHPVAEVGIDDDWSYIRSARLMAETGHFHYVGWASAMLGWLLPLGAAFIRIFGFSFTAVRASMWLLAVLSALLLQRCFARGGLNAWNATLATLTCVLSPIYLPLATTYMTDTAGFFTVLVCLYCCLRALQTASDRASTAWLILACVLTAIGGTARQTGWLALYIMVPCAGWLLRRRRLPWIALGLCWLLSCGFTEACLRWFSHQPYSLGEALVAGYLDRDLIALFLGHVTRAGLKGCLLALPVTLAFVPLLPRLRGSRKGLLWACAAIVLFYGIVWHFHDVLNWLAPFDGNFFTEHGLVDMPQVGERPVMLAPWFRVLLTLVTFAASLACVAVLLGWKEKEAAARFDADFSPNWKQMAILQGPYAAVYLLLTLHRALFAQFFDRYWEALLFVPLLLVLLWYQAHARRHLPALSVAAVAAMAVFSVAANHDLFVRERARVQAADELLAAGVPRTQFYGGWEYDGWTQIDVYGFANSGTMNTPQGFSAASPIPLPWVTKPCGYWAAHMAVAVHPKYAISFDNDSCAGPAPFAPVKYRLWLPPFHSALFIERVTEPPLVGAADPH